MEFLELNEQEYNEFAIHHPYKNFWQSVPMANLRRELGWNVVYLGVKENNEIQAASLITYRDTHFGKTYFQAMRGYLIDFRNKELLTFFHNHLIAYAKRKKCMYLKIDPYIFVQQRNGAGELVENGFDNRDIVDCLSELGYQHQGYSVGYDDLSEPRWMYYRDLNVDQEAELLKSFDQQTRWSINKTIKTGIQIKEVKYEELNDYKKMMEHTSSRRGFIDHTFEYYQAMYKHFSKSDNFKILYALLDLNIYEHNINESLKEEQANLVGINEVLETQPTSKKFTKKKKVCEEAIAGFQKKLKESSNLRKKGDVITLAGSIFIPYGDEVMYLFSGAYDEYMHFNGPYALQWYMMKYALANGYKRYNFYGISGIFNESAEDYGIYEFKNGFKGEVGELIGDFKYIVDPKSYHLYEGLRKLKNKIKH
ncbi:MAG: peptidoglycan bridge formation glycyltransferase FemA/FemB family protein [Erysipelotrichaceae bacterium]